MTIIFCIHMFDPYSKEDLKTLLEKDALSRKACNSLHCTVRMSSVCPRYITSEVFKAKELDRQGRCVFMICCQSFVDLDV